MKVKYVILVSLFCLLWGAQGYGQNLVPNPSFEQLDFCPFQINQIHAATGWQNWRETPELFNGCAIGSLGIPYTGLGYQYAHSGSSMAGIVVYKNPNGAAGPNRREYIACQLTQPLVQGIKYYVSFYTNLANFNGTPYPSNNIGLNFSTVQFSDLSPFPIINMAKLNISNVITDTINWTYCTGSFISDSAYTYICLGNFFHDSLTSAQPIGPSPNTGYYYIDDVCVSTDSLFNSTWTSIDNSLEPKKEITLFPNPVISKLLVRTTLDYNKVYIYNAQAKLCLSTIVNMETQIDLTSFANGLYCVVLSNGNNYISNKIIIKH